MTADILNAFLEGARKVLSKEAKSTVSRTGLFKDPTDQVSDAVIVYVSIVGQLRGMLLIGMPKDTARNIASVMLDEPQPELTEMGFSALAELANLIAGGTCTELEKIGMSCDITPPTIMFGGRSRLSTLALPRYVIPLNADKAGDFSLHVAVAPA